MGVLRFQLFGFPVRVEPSYWFITLLLGWWLGRQSVALGLVMVAIIFVSILVHELGHAVVARSFGLQPQISLHMMGGTTAFAPSAQLTRGRDILISLAGPFFGFMLGIAAWLLLRIYLPANYLDQEGYEPSTFILTLTSLAWVNVVWGAINLVPVIPFDGGRVLAAALGPQRRQITAAVSLVVGLSAAFLFLQAGWLIVAMLLGMSALTSFLRMRQSDEAPPEVNDESLKQALSAARKALDNGAHEQAIMLARGVLGVATQRQYGKQAMEILIWALLAESDGKSAREALLGAPEDLIDPYVAGAAHEAAGAPEDAQRILSRARAMGDNRVEVTALLVKVMLAQGKYSAAANLTREIADKIAPDDVRRVAIEAEQGGAHAEAARLNLQLAKAERSFRDACAAVIGFAKAGAHNDLVEAFKLARSFDHEGSRKLLQDERLGEARSQLEAV